MLSLIMENVLDFFRNFKREKLKCNERGLLYAAGWLEKAEKIFFHFLSHFIFSFSVSARILKILKNIFIFFDTQ